MRPAMTVAELLAVSKKVCTKSCELRAEAILVVAESKKATELSRQMSLTLAKSRKRLPATLDGQDKSPGMPDSRENSAWLAGAEYGRTPRGDPRHEEIANKLTALWLRLDRRAN